MARIGESAVKAFSLIGECAEKSELVRRLVVELTGRGLRVSTIKRVSDAVDLERQGSGTWKHRAAGAEEVMVANARRLALMRELPNDIDEPDVDSLLARMAPVDIVLLDGFRRSRYPKMEVIQTGHDHPQFAMNDSHGSGDYVREAGIRISAQAAAVRYWSTGRLCDGARGCSGSWKPLTREAGLEGVSTAGPISIR